MKRHISMHMENWVAKIPFRISRHTAYDFPCVVVEIGQNGVVGRGEALGVYYLGDTEQSMLEQLQSIEDELANGADRQALLELLPPGGPRFAVDAALWDLEAQLSGRSAWETAGVTEESIESVFTIGLESEPRDMAERAAAVPDLKSLKIKLNHDRPVERIQAIRAARPDVRMFVDVNEGWNFEQLKEFAPQLEGWGVDFIEQPLRRGHDEVLEDYDCPLPLCADESVQHIGEIATAAHRYQMINIKLDKSGGLTHGLEMAAAIRDKGLGLMVGCMGGTSLCMAPHHVIGHLADYVDIDGPLLLRNDRLDGFVYEGGMVSLPDARLWGR